MNAPQGSLAACCRPVLQQRCSSAAPRSPEQVEQGPHVLLYCTLHPHRQHSPKHCIWGACSYKNEMAPRGHGYPRFPPAALSSAGIDKSVILIWGLGDLALGGLTCFEIPPEPCKTLTTRQHSFSGRHPYVSSCRCRE